jgi:hypothetical protein
MTVRGHAVRLRAAVFFVLVVVFFAVALPVPVRAVFFSFAGCFCCAVLDAVLRPAPAPVPVVFFAVALSVCAAFPVPALPEAVRVEAVREAAVLRRGRCLTSASSAS